MQTNIEKFIETYFDQSSEKLIILDFTSALAGVPALELPTHYPIVVSGQRVNKAISCVDILRARCTSSILILFKGISLR